MVEFNLDRDRVFIAGLSAGGAMAAVMGQTYPDVYAAVGIHSGLAYKSASDVVSAFAAMRGNEQSLAQASRRNFAVPRDRVRTIVFQGTSDPVVNFSNAGKIVEAARLDLPHATLKSERGVSADGQTYTRSSITGADGARAVECWMIDGGGHAWSGEAPAVPTPIREDLMHPLRCAFLPRGGMVT